MRVFEDVPPLGPLHRACALILERSAGTRSGSGTLAGRPPPLGTVQDLTMAGPGGPLALRLITPEAKTSPALLVWLHGGGFTHGGLDSHEVPLRALAAEAGCAVLAVDYRLAPSHPFPAALEDAHAALLHAAAHAAQWGADPAFLAVGGDSAGGNLAAGAARLSRDRGSPPLAMQVLVYPDADARRGYNHPSWREHDGLILSRDSKDASLDLYLPDAIDRRDPLVSPALSEIADLARLPPALILTAEYDPQRDEGERYASLLRAAGVPVALKRFAGMIHGFWQMGALRAAAAEANRLIAEQIAACYTAARDKENQDG